RSLTLGRLPAELQAKVDLLTTSSLESLLTKIRKSASRENAAQDNRHDKANYYTLAYETLRPKLNESTDAQFRQFRLPLLGDKDQEKILDIVSKVKKHNKRGSPAAPTATTSATLSRVGYVYRYYVYNFYSCSSHIGLQRVTVAKTEYLNPQQLQVLRWIREKVSVSEYFRPFRGNFKGQFYNTTCPPPAQFSNNPSCPPFAEFIRTTLLAQIQTGAISLLGRVSEASPPYLILPLTVEPMKPRLCHDARFLNLWMTDAAFKLPGSYGPCGLDTATHSPVLPSIGESP
ncbi:Hypothetical predicted protein, partial [Paramuricea clavata]